MEPTIERIIEICTLEIQASTPTDPALFDRITGQLAAAGVAIDPAATASARTESPNVIAVFEWDDEGNREFYYIVAVGGEAEVIDYRGKIDVYLVTLQNEDPYGDEIVVTKADVAGLRYIERDGQRWYDSDDISIIEARKAEKRRAWREARRTTSLVLPDEFLALCEEVKQEPAAILQGFIADLCWLEKAPYNSHGSDERDMAKAYLERVGYRWWAKEEGEGGNDKG